MIKRSVGWSCTLLHLLILRFLACFSRIISAFSWSNFSCLRAAASVAVTGVLSAVALSSYLDLGKAVAQRISAVAESTALEARLHRRRFSCLNIAELPAPVQRYFKYALSEGQTYVKFVCVKQTGWFRTAMAAGEAGWKKVKAEQYYSTTEPGFVWAATIELAPLLWIRGWDSYVRGCGNMYWKLCSLFTVEDTRGKHVDRSALIRYLSECPCFPTALLPGRYVSWEPIDDTSARCHLRDRGFHVSGVFYFNEAGQITRFTTDDRVRMLAGGMCCRNSWTGYYKTYKDVRGMQVPTQLTAVWELPDGQHFEYARLEVSEIRSWDSVDGGLMAKAQHLREA